MGHLNPCHVIVECACIVISDTWLRWLQFPMSTRLWFEGEHSFIHRRAVTFKVVLVSVSSTRLLASDIILKIARAKCALRCIRTYWAYLLLQQICFAFLWTYRSLPVWYAGWTFYAVVRIRKETTMMPCIVAMQGVGFGHQSAGRTYSWVDRCFG